LGKRGRDYKKLGFQGGIIFCKNTGYLFCFYEKIQPLTLLLFCRYLITFAAIKLFG
jgi:hypothetical protein